MCLLILIVEFNYCTRLKKQKLYVIYYFVPFSAYLIKGFSNYPPLKPVPSVID